MKFFGRHKYMIQEENSGVIAKAQKIPLRFLPPLPGGGQMGVPQVE